jgi:hypothetical protein
MSHFLAIEALDMTLVFLPPTIVTVRTSVVIITIVLGIGFVLLLLVAIFDLVSRNLAIVTHSIELGFELLATILDEERLLSL